MLEWLYWKLWNLLPWESKSERKWKERVKDQHDDLQKASFFPVPDNALVKSDARYSCGCHRSVLFDSVSYIQRMIFPIRALYYTGATILIGSEAGYPANPTLAIDNACRFRIDAMEAALNCTPADLLVLMASNLPNPSCWEQSSAWRAKAFDPDLAPSQHSLVRHAVALFLERSDTPAADFLAFKEAALVLENHGLFQTEIDDSGAEREQIGNVISDIFPTLRAKECRLLARKAALIWHSEGPEQSPVIPDNCIGRGGLI